MILSFLWQDGVYNASDLKFIGTLSIRHVTVNYGDVLALEDISLAVEPGRLMALMRPNGAGKSSLFNALLGLVPMHRALVIAILVGSLCAVVGSDLMVPRLALLGDTIRHSVLPDLALAFWWGFNIYVGAFIAGLLSRLLIA